MAQRANQKIVNNFIKGLITEAGELSFPEGASVDELNCDLRKDGSRRRRLGVAIEDSAVAGPVVNDEDIVTSGDWVNAGGVANKEFLVVQIGGTLYFYNKGAPPYSGDQAPFTVDLNSFSSGYGLGAAYYHCSFTSLKGYLVVSSGGINSFYVKYSSSTNTITTGNITHNVRDFEWQGDTSTYYEAGSSTEVTRLYDAENSGWGATNAPAYDGKPLTMPWYAGKDADGNYDSAEWDKIFAGSSLTANGHNILNFFAKVRSGITTEIETSRFKCAEAFSGRVFYAGLDSEKNSGTILFSRLIENVSDFGVCHQVNDPTAEYLSDLLDTDGGEIKIPDCVGIKRLYAFRTSLYIFAENGVWSISGVDGIFKASAYSINRVSNVGITTSTSFVAAEGIPLWWSRFGIHTLNFDQVSGTASEQNLSIPTIQSYWDDIPANSKDNVTAVYDNISKRVYWFYPDDNEPTNNKLNNALILDVPLQAFFPWRISDDNTESSVKAHVVGAVFYSGYGASDLVINVITSNGDNVVSNSSNVVVTRQHPFNSGDSAIILLVRSRDTKQLTMATFTSTGFTDWGNASYTSFAETGYDFIGDLTLKKNAPFLTVYSRLTEEGFEYINGEYEVVRPSSLLVSTAWDFKETFNEPQQAYRLKYPVVVDSQYPSIFNYPEEMIVTRLKVRGHGRSVRIRFESEGSNDFILLGYAMVQGVNGRP